MARAMHDEIGSAFFSARRVLPVCADVGGTFAASFPADDGAVADRIRRWVYRFIGCGQWQFSLIAVSTWTRVEGLVATSK
jgi:hypothetical protein